jgi:hypothetical protein
MQNLCNNCGSHLSDKYCGHCGMKKNDGRIYFKDQWHDAMYYIFSLDSPLWRTFKGFMTRPGKTGIEYIKGKRKQYYTPVKYFILASAVYFLVVKLTGYNPVEMQYKAMGSKPPISPIADTIRNNVNYFLFILIFIMSLFMKIFFPRQWQTYPENLSYSFFIIGHFILLDLIFVPLSFVSPIFTFGKYFMLFYLIWAVFSFYSGNVFLKALKSFLTVILSYVVYIAIVFFMVLLYYKMSGIPVMPR